MPPTNSSDDKQTNSDDQAAVEVIRDKVARIYNEEPTIEQEIAESQQISTPERTSHQQFIYNLNNSGKDLVTIQTEWHNYYQNLPANEKHQVWQEFYDSQSKVVTTQPATAPAADVAAQNLSEHKAQAAQPPRSTASHKAKTKKLRDARSAEQLQSAIRDKVTAGGKLEAKHQLQSLLFGLGVGAVVVFVFLFSFFNQVIIAPFIQPSRVAAATPLIVSASSVSPTSTPEVIIPKINVQIPLNLTETSTNEAAIESDLEDGVVHYPTTPLPGQLGNAAFFGHSSNNIFNSGHYKFAFVLLHTLVDGDTFYLTYNDKVYVYQVINHYIVNPSDVSVLNSIPGQTATATLITCDPPGTSINRLIVVGKQISPDPAGNSAATTTAAASNESTSLPGNGPSLLKRVLRTFIGKVLAVIIVVAIIYGTYRWVESPKKRQRAAGS